MLRPRASRETELILSVSSISDTMLEDVPKPLLEQVQVARVEAVAFLCSVVIV